MKALLVHYKNKYPNGKVEARGNDIDVYNQAGEHCVAIRNGVCQSKELGCLHVHDLAPIPKDSRLFKLDRETGHVIKDDKHDSRKESMKKYLSPDGHIPSCEALAKLSCGSDERAKWEPEMQRLFDDKQNLKPDAQLKKASDASA